MRQHPFFPYSFFLLLFCLSSQAFGGDEREQLRDQLLKIEQQIPVARERFTDLLHKSKIPLPSMSTVAFAAFEADLKKWQQIVNDETKDLANEPIMRFNNRWKRFIQQLSTPTNEVQDIASTADRYPHIATVPEFQRCLDFSQKSIERVLAGSINPPIETEINNKEQNSLALHHRLLFKALKESVTTGHKPWALLPVNAPALTKYLEICRSIIASLERAIVQGPLSNEAEMAHHEATLSLNEKLVNSEEHRRLLMGALVGRLPITSPAVVALFKCQDRRDAALIAHFTEGAIGDEDEKWDRTYSKIIKLSEIAEEWITITIELSERPDVTLAGLPADLRADINKQWAAADAACTLCETSLSQALTEGNYFAALRAKGELSIAIRQYEMIEENLDEQRDHTVLVTALRAKAADPKVAALLLKIDTVNKAFILAQKKLNISELAALHGQLAIEIATAEAEETQQAQELATHSAENLSAERESLIEEAKELIGETPQGPPPDQSPPF